MIWFAEARVQPDGTVWVSVTDGKISLAGLGYQSTHEDLMPRACLMAAAPEMYEALKQAEGHLMETSTTAWDMVRKALKKAEGA